MPFASPLRALAACGLSLTVVGCGGAPAPGEPTGSAGASVITPDLFTNDKAAFDYFVGKGLTNFQAAGIVGNLDQESGVDPAAVQSGGPGRGIAQWSVGGRWDTDANDNAVWYASKQGASVGSLQLQLDFIWYELQTFSGYGLGALKATTNVTDATVAFEKDFEGCGTCDESTRIAYAQGVLSAYGSIAYAAQFVSQSFPLASTTMTMTEGQVVPAYIELKNVGTKTWDSNTKLATTQPRDRASAFADGTWLAPNRLAAVQGTVPPGGTYKFTFDLAASKTGTFDEFFGVVEEGVAWFSDPGQGGPPDNDLEVKIAVAPGDGGAAPSDAGVHASDAGDAGGKRTGDAGSAVEPDAAGEDGGPGLEGAGDGGEGGASTYGAQGGPGSGGCSVGAAPAGGSPWTAGLGLLAAAAFAGRARVRGSRSRR